MDLIAQYGLRWAPVTGDDTTLGWATVGLYFAAAALSTLVMLSRRSIFTSHHYRQYVLWGSLILIMLALGFNKQLDIQTLFTEIARYFSHEHGWYGERKTYQLMFIGAVVGFSVFLSLFLLYIYRYVLFKNSLVIVGLCFLLCFVAVRAASFHGFDDIINETFAGYRVNAVLEMPGIVLIILNAIGLLLFRRKPSLRPQTPS